MSSQVASQSRGQLGQTASHWWARHPITFTPPPPSTIAHSPALRRTFIRTEYYGTALLSFGAEIEMRRQWLPSIPNTFSTFKKHNLQLCQTRFAWTLWWKIEMRRLTMVASHTQACLPSRDCAHYLQDILPHCCAGEAAMERGIHTVDIVTRLAGTKWYVLGESVRFCCFSSLLVGVLHHLAVQHNCV